MIRPQVFLSLMAVLVVLSTGRVADAQTPTAVPTDTNSNIWAGYRATTADGIRSITGSFSEGSNQCTTKNPSVLLIGVGFGTAGTPGAAQVGIGALCPSQGAIPIFYAWYRVAQTSQFVPLTIHEGDDITADAGVFRDDPNKVDLLLVVGRNESSWHQGFDAPQADKGSAGCLVERARLGDQLSPVPNFANLAFDFCDLQTMSDGSGDIRNLDGQLGTNEWDVTRYTMVRFKPTGVIVPLAEIGDSRPPFTFWSVGWRHN